MSRPDLMDSIPDGYVAVVKADCPTCELVVPVLSELADLSALTVITQDDPGFPTGLSPQNDTQLEFSWRHDIETVPTLIKVVDSIEVGRVVGWSRPEWETFTGLAGLGPELPEHRPGCGSLSVDPTLIGSLNERFRGHTLTSPRVIVGEYEDEIEAMYDRGWSDGLPLVPPTPVRVLAMLAGTSLAPTSVVATVPPNLVEVTVEQVAVNAVMAGCRPEYLPVVLAALAASCTHEFNMHGLIATTYFSGPIIVVNGSVTDRIGMNHGGNVLGQGNRANLTIGRALQLVIRNLGGGRPGELDMAAQGSPSKLGLCFAEDEAGSPFSPLSVHRGLEPGTDAVTLFAGHGPTAVVDQISREPESLARSLASALKGVAHPKLAIAFDAMLVVSPEHGRVFAEAGWDRHRLLNELTELLASNGDELIRGADGIAEGLPVELAGMRIDKFRPDGLQIVHAGGQAGLFSSILGGWVASEMGSTPVTKPIEPWY